MTQPHPEKDSNGDETPTVRESGQDTSSFTVEEALSNRQDLPADEVGGYVPGAETAEYDETVTISEVTDSGVEEEGENYSPAEGSESEEPSHDGQSKPAVLPLVCLGVGLIVGFFGQYAVNGVQDIIKAQNATVFNTVVSDCNLEDRDGVALSNNNKTLSIDTKGKKEDSGASEQNAGCVVQALSIPEEVFMKVANTEMDSPQQTADWENKSISWEFSTDNGIKLEFNIKS